MHTRPPSAHNTYLVFLIVAMVRYPSYFFLLGPIDAKPRLSVLDQKTETSDLMFSPTTKYQFSWPRYHRFGLVSSEHKAKCSAHQILDTAADADHASLTISNQPRGNETLVSRSQISTISTLTGRDLKILGRESCNTRWLDRSVHRIPG